MNNEDLKINQRRNKNLGLPLKYLQEDIDIFKNKKILEKINNYIDNFDYNLNNSIYFYGSSGTGKSFLLTYVANEIVESIIIPHNEICYQYNKIEELLTLKYIQATDFFYIFEEKNIEKINELKNIDILCIDDIDKYSEIFKKYTKYNLLFDNFIRYRYQKNLTNLITSQVDYDLLIECFNESIASILFDKTLVIEVIDDNFRKPLKDNN